MTSIADFEARLIAMETHFRLLERHVECARRIMVQEQSALRQQLDSICLAQVVELAMRALKEAQRNTSDADLLQHLRSVGQKTQEPLGSSRMAGYDTLRSIHKGCVVCKPKQPCSIARAVVMLRDLLILTICTGHGPWDNDSLKVALEDALAQGCNRQGLDKVEHSQLTLAFNKVLSLGKNRAGFDERVLSPNAYGPNLSQEEVNRLFVAYSGCWRTAPNHISKNKAAGKHRKKNWAHGCNSSGRADARGCALVCRLFVLSGG